MSSQSLGLKLGVENHELSNPGFFNPRLGVGKSSVEKSRVGKFMVEMSFNLIFDHKKYQ